jgi:acetamidase/formamidase
MAHHHLDGSFTHPRWQRDAPPRLTIASGDTVTFDCPEPCGQVTPDWTADDLANRWDPTRVHALLGPVDVIGAAAGGSIQIDLLEIGHHGWGWSGLIPGFGLIHERFPQPYLHHWRLSPAGCHLGHRGIVVPCRPFVGCVGVAPATDDVLDTIPPRENAGNLDLNDLTAGASLRLPVFRDGAGVCLGDGHAAQGDGELGGTAVEAPLTVTARLTALPDHSTQGVVVHPPAEPPTIPRPTSRLTVAAVGPDPRAAAKQATHRMVDRLAEALDLPDPVAMVLCSAAADLRIAQAVNEPNWTVAVSIALDRTGPA